MKDCPERINRRRLKFPAWLVTPSVVLAIYTAAYFGLLEGKSYLGPIATNPVTGANTYLIAPRYRTGGYTTAFFAPIHALDRHVVRPDYWGP